MIKAKINNKTGGGDFPQCPAGNHEGVLAALIDLGTHWNSYQGQAARKVRKLFYVFEVEAEGAGGKDERFFIGREFNVSVTDGGEFTLGQKSNLRKFLTDWRGTPFGEDEDIDFEKAVGKPALVNVVHDNKGDRTYAVIGSVAKLGRKFTPIKPSHEPFSYSADDDGAAVPDYDWLPFLFGKKVEEWVGNSLEHGGSGDRDDLWRQDGQAKKPSRPLQDHTGEGDEDRPDEIPF